VDLLLMDRESAAGLFSVISTQLEAPAPKPTGQGPAPVTIDVKILAKSLYDRTCTKPTKLISICQEIAAWQMFGDARDKIADDLKDLALTTCDFSAAFIGAVPLFGDAFGGSVGLVCGGAHLLDSIKSLVQDQLDYEAKSELMLVLRESLKRARKLSSHCTTFSLLFTDGATAFLKATRPLTQKPEVIEKTKLAVHAAFCSLVKYRIANTTIGLALSGTHKIEECATVVDKPEFKASTMVFAELEIIQAARSAKACKVPADFETALNNYINAIFGNTALVSAVEVARLALSKEYAKCYNN